MQGRERNYIKDGGPALQVESTAYTLLTMAALNKLDDAGPVVVWLTEHRNSRGSFYSTQVNFVHSVYSQEALTEKKHSNYNYCDFGLCLFM